MQSRTLEVTGMTCGHCRARVEEALKGVRGVFGVMVDLDAGRAEVDFDEAQASIEELSAAVDAVGYSARVGDEQA